MLRRAAPRVVVFLLLCGADSVSAGMTPGAPAEALHWTCSLLLPFTVFGPKRWWRSVKYGKPAPWQVDHEGATALYVTDPGRGRLQVATHLREHGGLNFGEALKRADDPFRPVWDDLTTESAGQMASILTDAGATVRVGLRPRPPWARDVTTQ